MMVSFLSEKRTSRISGGGTFALLLLFTVACSSSKSSNNRSDGVARIDDLGRQDAGDVPPRGVAATISDRDATQNSESPKKQSAMDEARSRLAAGELESAVETMRAHLLAHPSDVRGLFLAAELEAVGGRYLDAVALLDEIPRDHPQAGLAALGQSADWLLAAQQWDVAEDRFDALLKMAPTANMAHRRLAYLLNRQGRRQEASSHVRFLCRAGDVTQSELHTLINECEAIYDEARDSDSSASRFAPIGAQAEARVLFSKNEFKLALDRLRQPMKAGELRSSGRAFFGRLATEVEDQDAIAVWVEGLDEAQEQFGDHWVALATLMLREATDIERAARVLCEAIVRNPTDSVAMSRLENCMDTMGDADQKFACRARTMLLRKTNRVNQRIVGNTDPKPSDIVELAFLLDSLHRPVEAVMWRAIGLAQRNAPPEVLGQLEANRQRLISEEPYPMRPMDALAGLELTRFPLAREFSENFKANEWPKERAAENGLDSDATPVFPNIGNSVGINFQYFNASQPKFADLQLYEQFGGGVAAMDYDLNGRVDLYFNQGGDDPKADTRGKSNALFRNLGGRFVVVPHAGTGDDGYGQGVTSGDWNQDGFPDLVVANFGVNALMINNGDGTFRRAEMGDSWMTPFWTTSVAMADVTGDGLPDIVEVNYADDAAVHVVAQRGTNGRFVQSRGPESYRAAGDRVFVSRGDGSMSTAALAEADQNGAGHGLGIVVTDVDGVVGNEMFVANDTDANQLWSLAEESTPEKGHFVNLAGVRGCAYSAQGGSGASMGIATADFDRNGMIDFHVTNFYNESSHLYLQNHSNVFTDSVIKSDLFQPSLRVLGFGTQALDYDNNGTVDLAVVNGHIDDFRSKDVPHKMLPQLFAGTTGRFVQVEVDDSTGYWNHPAIGRGLLLLDWNRDGRMDLVATHHDVPAALLQNQTESENYWIQLRLVGTTSERDAIGATVTIQASGQEFHAVVTAGDGYACKNESIVAFGLGPIDRIDQMTVRWPNGNTQLVKVQTLNQRYLIVEGSPAVFADH